MTSLKFATAVHALLLLAHAHADAPAKALSSRYLASSIAANAVVVRRVLSALASAGLVATKAGAYGGAWLAVPAETIALDRVFFAVEEPEGIGCRTVGNPACPVGRVAPDLVRALVREMRDATAVALQLHTLADLLRQTVG